MIIIGAGLAGLTAAALLRDEASEIWEAQSSLPNNHSALLRFRSSILGDSLNIPFKKVTVLKDVDSTGNDLRDALRYSKKTNGSYTLRSIRKETVERFIAPDDFISRLQKKVMAQILFDTKFHDSENINPHHPRNIAKPIPIISTIPMPTILNMVKHPFGEISFSSRKGFTISGEIDNCNTYCTMYFPSEKLSAYRASITGSKFIIEYSDLDSENFDPVRELLFYGYKMGLDINQPKNILVKNQKFMKILPIDEEKRKRIILWLTEEFNIYSFGRFATWRPGLLLDDLVKDLQVIQKIIASKNNYDERR